MGRRGTARLAQALPWTLALALSAASAAHAESPLRAGALSGQVWAEPGGHTGGGLLLDTWAPVGLLRLGFAAGVTAIPSANSDGRVFVPLLASAALALGEGSLGFELTLRGGAWAGAIKSGLVAGGMVMAGAHVGYGADPRVRITLGVDFVHQWAHGDRSFWAPTLGLRWTLDAEDAP